MVTAVGKVVAITGAASGIGLALAKLLSSQGYIISLADINRAGLEEALQAISNNKFGTGPEHMTTVLDVRDSKQVDDWIRKTVARYGRLDCAANIAGIVYNDRQLKDESDERFATTMQVNVYGVFYCLRAELNNMKEGASIVNIASVAGLRGFASLAAYSSSKHAVVGLTKSAARENPGIRVNAVAPGRVNTPMVQNLDPTTGNERLGQQIMNRAADPREVAHALAFLLSDDASFVTGAIYNVDGGWMA